MHFIVQIKSYSILCSVELGDNLYNIHIQIHRNKQDSNFIYIHT